MYRVIARFQLLMEVHSCSKLIADYNLFISLEWNTISVFNLITIHEESYFSIQKAEIRDKKRISYFTKPPSLRQTPWEIHSNTSDQISRSVVSDFLRPHESQHARPPCPSPTPGVHSDSRPLSQ